MKKTSCIPGKCSKNKLSGEKPEAAASSKSEMRAFPNQTEKSLHNIETSTLNKIVLQTLKETCAVLLNVKAIALRLYKI